jgi:hypothetical protein
VLENALLRQQLIVLRRQTKRPKLSWRDRALIILLASKLRFWKQALVIVQPDTVLRDATARHRDLFRRVWRRKSKPKKKPGRPPLADEVFALIEQMARHLPTAEKTAPGARTASAVDIATMPDFHNRYRNNVIFDLIQDAIVALSDAVLFVTTQLLRPSRPGVVSKTVNTL